MFPAPSGILAQEKFLSLVSFAILDAGFVLVNCGSVSSLFLEQGWAQRAHVVWGYGAAAAGEWGRVKGLSSPWLGKGQGDAFMSPLLG